MVQATEVTSIVIARREKEYLEQRVQQQWTELEAIYSAAPVGLALYDPEQFRLLRLNDKLAEILRVPAGEVHLMFFFPICTNPEQVMASPSSVQCAIGALMPSLCYLLGIRH